MPNRYFITVGCLALLIRSANGGELELKRLRTEAPEAVRRLSQAYSQLQAEGDLTTRVESPKSLGISAQSLVVDGDLEKAVQTFFVDRTDGKRTSTQEFVLCRNKKAVFSLTRDFQKGGLPALSNLQSRTPKGQRQNVLEARLENSIKISLWLQSCLGS